MFGHSTGTSGLVRHRRVKAASSGLHRRVLAPALPGRGSSAIQKLPKAGSPAFQSTALASQRSFANFSVVWWRTTMLHRAFSEILLHITWHTELAGKTWKL